LSALALILIVACSGKSSNNITIQDNIPPSATRIVSHAMGKTSIPANPKRIVTLTTGGLAHALALGVIPIGASWGVDEGKLEPYQPYLHNQQLTYLGSMQNPNLEKILLLKPDLIVGEPLHKRIYNHLSRIAPTVLNDMSYVAWDWKKHLRFSGEVLDKTQEVEKLLSEYYQRILELRQKLGSRIPTTRVSIVYLDSTSISFLLKDSLAGMILQDIGILRPPAQDKRGAYGDLAFSFETIAQMDGDVIFLISPEDKDSLSVMTKLKDQPLWLQLKAVRQDKVYQVDAKYWLSWNVIGANLILDDLFKYLLNQ
jgi:iron complex transport system substrate-binding protein